MFDQTLLIIEDDSIPVGKKAWRSMSNETIELNINACTDNEYGCFDGSCIDKYYRCNHVFDCEYAEDESNCSVLAISPAYDVLVPVSSKQKLVNMSIELVLLNMLKMDPYESLITLQFESLIIWCDDRLQFRNLEPGLTILSFEDWSNIWVPNFLIERTKYFEETRFMIIEKNSLVTVKIINESKFEHIISEHSEDFYYTGDNVKIRKANKYTVELICDFNWQAYPFDIQICKMEIKLISLKSEQIVLNATVTNLIKEFSTFSVELINATILYDDNLPKVTYIHTFNCNKIKIILIN